MEKEILCLLYHRVNPVKDSLYDLTVSPLNFDQQMQYIKEQYHCLRFEEDWAGKDSSVVITFDDGYADNLHYALPILEKYDIPATIFVTSGNIGTRNEFWWDELGRLMTLDKEYPKSFELEDPMFHYCWETDTLQKRIELAKTLRWLLRMNENLSVRECWLDQVRKWINSTKDGRNENRSLNEAELLKLQKSKLITIGAHTVHHMSLGAMNREQQFDEINTSIQDIQRITGFIPDVFSYPFGTKLDFNENTLSICKELGLKKACTTESKKWNPSFDCYKIPRKTIRDWDLTMFKKQIDLFWGEN